MVYPRNAHLVVFCTVRNLAYCVLLSFHVGIQVIMFKLHNMLLFYIKSTGNVHICDFDEYILVEHLSAESCAGERLARSDKEKLKAISTLLSGNIKAAQVL